MPDYLTANVTYKGLEDKGLTVALIDQDKKKWTIWKKDYKDKEADSEPYRALALYKFGETFGVSYGEKEEEFTGKDGKLVKFKRKTIYSIMPPIKNPTGETVAPVKKSAPEPKYESTETNWDEIAVGKTQSLFLAAFIQSGKSFSEAKLQVTQARQLAELVVYGTQKTVQSEIPLPEAPPEQDEPDVSQIPF